MLGNPKIRLAILVLVTSAASFGFGRWSVKTTSTTKTSVAQSHVTDDKNAHTRVTVTDVKAKDGTETKTIVADRVSDDVITTNSAVATTQIAAVKGKTSNINISLLGANDLSKGALIPTYGLSVTREVLGPVTVGAFGLMNGTVGVSVGLDF
jgi:hypothetical protein